MAHLQLAAGAVRLNHRGVLQLVNHGCADIGQVFLPQGVTLRQFGFRQARSFCFMSQRIDARDFFFFHRVLFLSLYKDIRATGLPPMAEHWVLCHGYYNTPASLL